VESLFAIKSIECQWSDYLQRWQPLRCPCCLTDYKWDALYEICYVCGYQNVPPQFLSLWQRIKRVFFRHSRLSIRY
jgi:hypothetical protein